MLSCVCIVSVFPHVLQGAAVSDKCKVGMEKMQACDTPGPSAEKEEICE